jgi:transcription elongation factor GreA
VRTIKETERPENVRDIEEAIAHGDLSENAEYHAAKERQGLLDAELRNFEDKISRAEVIDPSTLDGDKVVFGATVMLFNIDTEEEVTYQIVGIDEADLKEGKISYASPLGRAIIGKEEGDEIAFKAPGGTRNYEVVEVQFI